MRYLLALSLAVAAIGFVASTASQANGQVAVEVGPAPDCPYGYYDIAPYNCAPYGYYGPEWFVDGVFIGAGPWYHGGEHFYGHVDNHFHPDHGFRGPFPNRGEHRDHDVAHMQNFHGNEMRDGRGHKR